MAPAPPRRIPELDGLRGIAIGSVLIFHYFVLNGSAPLRSPLAYLLAAGRLTWSGVDLFFVLSGFLIGGILLDARKATNYFTVFYTRRFFRIVPPYLVLLLIHVLLVALVNVQVTPSLQFMVANRLPAAAHFVFLQNFWMAAHNSLGSPTLAVTWSLAVEEQFYLTLPLVMRYLPEKWLVRFLISAVAIGVGLRLGLCFAWPENEMARFVLMPCRADALLLGVLGAVALRRSSWRSWLVQNRLGLRFVLALLAVGVAALTKFGFQIRGAAMAEGGYTWLAAFYLCLILEALINPNGPLARAFRLGWLRALGQVAYGTYLFHFVVLDLLLQALRSYAPRMNSSYDFLVALSAIIVTLIFCRLSWVLFESPLIRFSHRTSYNFLTPVGTASLESEVGENA